MPWPVGCMHLLQPLPCAGPASRPRNSQARAAPSARAQKSSSKEMVCELAVGDRPAMTPAFW